MPGDNSPDRVLVSGPREMALAVAQLLTTADFRWCHVPLVACDATIDNPASLIVRASTGRHVQLLIAEVHAMDAESQRRLLDLLSGRNGGVRRVIATTSQDLAACVARGTFDDRLLEQLAAVRVLLPGP
jgi:hypothetical protein